MFFSKIEAKTIFLAFVLTSALAVFAGSVSAGTVDPGDEGRKFTYGEALDWINFDPGFGPGVTVSPTAVTGYAWCNTAGWINLSPSSYGGVTHDGNGNLSGWAWSESAGWISFSCENTATCATVNYGVKIDLSTGAFEGYAWSDVAGWINFNLASTPYSDHAVVTSLDEMVIPSISGNAGVGGAILSYDDGGPMTATASANGDYSFTVSYGWSGTVTPSFDLYAFSPPNRTYSGVTTDQTDQDYTIAAIPSLNQWGLAILALVLLLVSIRKNGRRTNRI